ncbi:ribosyldihydronicotinamide dehydrogenase [quinone]-like [Suncus etruscus]|uniref:ribosyldihydronicotinamide dehydrogenase [quinone]-like n=1 Tax=Suncus etruscus TaxID=109475 RepID=UPI002110133C|nr:ribosyldihydronicotinamide dehydrogenase [quinone]-like [Suncus etruscus]
MAGKKVLIVYAHEEPRSFNAALKNVAVDELSKQDCMVTVTDLYAANFEPRTTRKDIAGGSRPQEHLWLFLHGRHLSYSEAMLKREQPVADTGVSA